MEKDAYITDSYDESLELLNILEKHGETLESLYDACTEGSCNFCDILMNNITSARDVVKALKEYNVFLKGEEQFLEYIDKLSKDSGVSAEEYKDSIDWAKTSDGYVVQLHY